MRDIKIAWLFILLVGLLSKVQSREVVPEDCDLEAQYFDRFESKCRNCSEVMRIFELGSSQDWQPLNSNSVRDQQANTTPNGGQSKPPTDPSQPPDQPQESRIRTELISSALGSKLTPLPATSASGRQTSGRRLVGGPPNESPSSETLPVQPARSRPIGRRQVRLRDHGDDQDEDDRERPDDSPAPLSATGSNPNANNQFDLQLEESGSNNEESDQDQRRELRNLSRLANKWQRLLMAFLSSHEIEPVGLESVEQCRANQNLSACQMWANICVLTMYSHSATGFSGQQQRQAPASAYSALRNLPKVGARRKSRIRSPDRGGRDEPRLSWQQCAKFELTTFCNSLREWRRLEKQPSEELADIFGNDNADGIRLTPTQSAPLKLGQEIQVLAYEHAFDGRLLSVSQYDLESLGEFCLFSLARHRNRADELRGQRILVGQSMSLRCQFSASQASSLAPRHLNETTFIDLFVGYQSNGATFLRPVPILLKNMLQQGQLVNMRHAKDPSRWKFVHRFFPIATLKLAAQNGGSDGGESSKKPEREEIISSSGNNNNNNNIDHNQLEEVLVFARSASFEIKLRRQQDKGLVINSMLLVLDYDHLSLFRGRPSSGRNAAAAANSSANFKASQLQESLIQVNQSLTDMQNYRRDLDLFVTIVCITSTIWTLIKCYNIQKYQGLIKLDIYSLGLFIVVACDIVADLLIAATLCFILLVFVQFKLALAGDQMQSFAPDDELEQNLLLKFKLALLFKLLGFLYKLRIRLKADIFFIDWERPKMLTSAQLMSQQQQHQQRPTSDSKQSQADIARPQTSSIAQHQISFWRPYTIINKWIQMQTLRRQNLTLQLVLLVALLKTLRLDELSATVPSLVNSDETPGVSPFEPRLAPRSCATFRALTLAVVYVTLATLQVGFKKLLYEPMIKSTVREFVDLCSVANVSLFAMLYPRFGFYVHGRNANGSGDCGIVEMNALLEREERDLCSRRGLLPNSDQQTFMMVLPKIINDYYRKLLNRLDQTRAHSSPVSFGRNGPIEKSLAKTQQQQAGDFIKSALSLSGSLSPVPPAHGRSNSFGSMRALVESVAARNKAINTFLMNFLDHAYKDIDYSVREQRPLTSLLMGTDQSDDDETASSIQNLNQNKLQARNIRNTSGDLNRALAINQTLADADQTVASLFVDSNNSFASLTWLGLEWDLMAIEMLLLLNLDLILGPDCLISTVGLLWLASNLFRAAYSTLARRNLINKSMLDEKFLTRN